MIPAWMQGVPFYRELWHYAGIHGAKISTRARNLIFLRFLTCDAMRPRRHGKLNSASDAEKSNLFSWEFFGGCEVRWLARRHSVRRIKGMRTDKDVQFAGIGFCSRPQPASRPFPPPITRPPIDAHSLILPLLIASRQQRSGSFPSRLRTQSVITHWSPIESYQPIILVHHHSNQPSYKRPAFVLSSSNDATKFYITAQLAAHSHAYCTPQRHISASVHQLTYPFHPRTWDAVLQPVEE
ncbi:hypothetical protein PSPO01_12316 [Paraphaeosphaeria sporulosa]